MYCPVDGAEYREGITRCPQHDVDLVDEALEPEKDERPLLEAIDDRLAVRLAFYVLLGAAAVYAVSGAVFGVMLWFPSLRESTEGAAENVFRIAQGLSGAAWAVGMAALGALAGAVLVRTYSVLRDPRQRTTPPEQPPGLADRLIRLLFVLVILFSVLWAGTGVELGERRILRRVRLRHSGGADADVHRVDGAPQHGLRVCRRLVRNHGRGAREADVRPHVV